MSGPIFTETKNQLTMPQQKNQHDHDPEARKGNKQPKPFRREHDAADEDSARTKAQRPEDRAEKHQTRKPGQRDDNR